MRLFNKSFITIGMILKNFVVFEGIDGSGTSTQLNILKARMATDLEIPVWFTWEPSDSPLGLLARSALKGEVKLNPCTLAHLFAADRCEHLEATNGIKRHCEQGELVICDRYVLSSLVYQGLECGEDLPALLNKNFPRPELMFLFDLPASTAAKRWEQRPEKDIYEKLDFQELVQERYRTLAKTYCAKGTELVIVDASQTINEVAEEVWTNIVKLPICKG